MIHRSLCARELWPDWSVFESARALTTHWGEQHLDALRRMVGNCTWQAALAVGPFPVPSGDIVRILGMGQLLTEFTLAPLAMPVESRQRLARLGALANLIVALYDHYLDGGVKGEQLLPRSALVLGRSALGRTVMACRLYLTSAERRLLGHLVRAYYLRLHVPARRSPAARSVLSLLHRAILRMYDAESGTVSPDERRPATLRRKAALPFVVMGAPGWLVASCSPPLYRWHLRWLYRVGLYFGQIDDVVDLEADDRMAHSNGLAAELLSMDTGLAAEGVADRVVRQAGSLVQSWRARVDGASLSHPVVSHALEIATCSWFGGPAWRPREAPEVMRAS